MSTFLNSLLLLCVVSFSHYANSSIIFADINNIDTTNNVVTGTLANIDFTFTGGSVGGVSDESFTLYNLPFFVPPIANSDTFIFTGNRSGLSYNLAFSAPVIDPIFHILSNASQLIFSGEEIVRLSGQSSFVVSGDRIIGDTFYNGTTPNNSNGSVQLIGTFTEINFTALLTLPSNFNTDGILFQVGLGEARQVPEPATWLIMLMGFGLIAYQRKRKLNSH
mgnify:CR=1 FL=1